MGASRDRVLIIARGECRASNHQVAPVLQAVEPAHDGLHAVLVYALAMSSLTELRLRETGRAMEIYPFALQMTLVRML